MSSAVMGESWASSAIRQVLPGSDARTSALQAPSGPRTSISAWAPAARAAVDSSSFSMWWARVSSASAQLGACGAWAKNRRPCRETLPCIGWWHSSHVSGAGGRAFHTAAQVCPHPRSGRCATFKQMITSRELAGSFTPSDEAIAWARDNTATDPHLLALAVWLKSYQRLGYFPKLDEVPEIVVGK